MRKISTTLAILGWSALALGAFAAAPAVARSFVYVSNAEDGTIDGFALDTASGRLTPLGATPSGKLTMPMTLSPDRSFLYAVVRSRPFVVVSYAIDPQTGALTQKARAPLPDSMAYVSTDASGRFLFTASYGGDKVAVSPVEATGVVTGAAIQVIPTGLNAHAIRAEPGNRFVYASNLGSNQILQFRFDAASGRLSPNDPPLIKVAPGNGPRHLVFSPDGRFLYVSNELSGQVSQFAVDPRRGTLKTIGYTATIEPAAGLLPGLSREAMAADASSGANTRPAAGGDQPRIWTADLQLTPNGRFLYVSDRTSSRIALLTVAPDSGRPSYVRSYPTETQPRGFRIDPSGRYLVAVGEKSDRLSLYRIDPASGALTRLGRYPVGHDANWVEIVERP